MAAQGLLPILSQRIREEFDQSPGAHSIIRCIPSVEQMAIKRGRFYSVALSRIQNDLDARGIRALPLKGPVLAEALYGDPGLRHMSDLDILVASEDLAGAAAVLAKQGYELQPEDHRERGLPRLHINLTHTSALLPPVELHWRVHWYERTFARDMLEACRLLPNGHRALPVHELAALLLFFARDGFRGLRLAADAARWWDLLGENEGEQPMLRPVIQRYPALEQALVASATVLDAAVGVPLERTVGRAVATTRRTRTAARLQNWSGYGEPDQLSANTTLIDGLLSPPGERLAFLRRWFFPGRAKLRRIYRVPSSSAARLLPLAAWHPTKLTVRYVIALLALARRSEWAPLPPGCVPEDHPRASP